MSEIKTFIRIPVEIPPKPEVKKNLLVCLKSLYIPTNDTEYQPLDPLHMVEWFELNKILGVDHVTAYIHSINTEQAKVFNIYVKQGFLDVLSSASPPDSDPNTVMVHSRSETINDCLYRNMYSYHKIMIMDTDEFMVPGKRDNLWDLISQVAENRGVSLEKTMFSLRNQHYYTDDPQLQPSLLLTQFAIKHIPPEKVKFRAKMILDSNVCFLATAHKCRALVPGTTDITLSAGEAVLHHYKACNTARPYNKPYNCKAMFSGAKIDKSMHRFGERLTQNVQKIKNIYIS